MTSIKLAFIFAIAFNLSEGKTLTCNEYLDVPQVQEEQIPSKKCTFSFVEFGAFDEVNISSAVIQEVDYENEVTDTDVSNGIEAVEFVESRFPHLPNDLFVKFSNLRSVLINGVNLSLLSRADFKVALKLEEFHANSNYIKSLDKMLFSGSTKLQTLDLSVNEISSIDRTAFFALENLKKVLLNDNQLRSLTQDVFEDLTSLEEINLSANQLKALPLNLFVNCKHLSLIYLNENQIQDVADEHFSAMKEIQFLHLSNNELSILKLNISASALYADHNQLTSVNLNSVGYSSFYNNSIREVVFADKKGVLSLNVSTNKLIQDSLKAFGDYSELKGLDLSFNSLGALNISTFLNMPQIQILNLQSTNLTEIGFGLFTHQTSLEQLDLSYNKLNTFDLTRLRSMKALTTLFIEGNQIKEIEYKRLKEMFPKLAVFGFSDNAWSCSYLSSLVSYLEQNEIEIYTLVLDKTRPNIEGIACSEAEGVNEERNYEDKSLLVNPIKHHQLLNHDNELKAISEKLAAVLLHVNATNEKFVVKSELINELNMIKSAMASLKRDMYDMKQQSEKTTIRSHTNETTSSHQQDHDEKLNGLGARVANIEQTLNGIKIGLQTTSTTERALPLKKVSSDVHDDFLMKLMITVVFFIVSVFAAIYFIQICKRRNQRKFITRRPRSEMESVDENIL